METTFDKFITNDVKQKSLFDKEYAEFLNSERTLEKLNNGRKNNHLYVQSKVFHKASVNLL